MFLAAAKTVLAHPVVWPAEISALQQRLASREKPERLDALTSLSSLPDAVVASLLEPALDDEDRDVQVAAGTLAVARSLAVVAPRVGAWLSDPEVRLRRLACVFLQPNPPDALLAPLARALGDNDPTVRRAAALALGHAASPDLAVGPLLGHLDDSAADVRQMVIESLAKLGATRAVVAIASKVQDPVVEVRRSAIRAVRELADATAEPSLLVALQDSDAAVRSDAAAALASFAGPNVVFALAALLEPSQPASTHSAALAALGRLASDQAARFILRYLDQQSSLPDDAPICDALLMLGDRAVSELMAFLRAPHREPVTTTALTALAASSHPDARRFLREGQQLGAWPLASLFRARARFPHGDDVPFLLERLGHPLPAFRHLARDALERALRPENENGHAFDVLLAQLHHAQTAAIEKPPLVHLLGKTGSLRATDMLATLLQHPALPIKLAALDALLTARPTAPTDALLVVALDDENSFVRAQAATTLAHVATRGATSALLRQIRDLDERDVPTLARAVAGALGRNPSATLGSLAAEMVPKQPGLMQDALLEGIARAGAPGPDSHRVLVGAARSLVVADRRKAAEVLVLLPSFHDELLRLARDPDASVRANAVWSLGRSAQPADTALLVRLTADASSGVAANALQSLGFLAQRAPVVRRTAAQVLCATLLHPVAHQRTAALAGLRLMAARCLASSSGTPRGQLEQQLLTLDSSVEVRHMALLLLLAVPVVSDARALVRCAYEESFLPLAEACARRRVPLSSLPTEPVSVVVTDRETEQARPEVPYALRRADGLLRHGVSDRRGTLFEPFAPTGAVALAPPAVGGQLGYAQPNVTTLFAPKDSSR